QIVGDRGAVHSLMGQGVDPHLYRPPRSDIARLAGADILFYNGLKLEPQMEESLDRLAAAGRPVIAVGERLDPALLLSPVEFAGHSDPHLWMDVALWRRATEAARDALIAFDPAGAETYAANAAAYLEKLTALDRFADRALASVPPSARVLVTAHDAFNYFGRAYGFEVIGIQGISTESEAGLRRIEELVDLLVERRIAAVFVETSVSDRNVRALIAGAAARGHRMSIGGALYSDAMGAPGTYEGTYIGMIDHNVTTIAAALGGEVSLRGMTGQLAALAD
ncbi:MAG: zinc ABC transporter solute-binding protein, partial [Inquilinus sp.]|nr:zinc ABC transporter solute-binding protein [Inquilinus sp.]